MTSPEQPKSDEAQVIPPVIVQNGPIPSVYAEGVTQILLGYPVSKLKLHSSSTRMTDDPNSQQVREICLDLTMPTGGMIEMCQKILQIISENRELLLKTKGEQEKVLLNALEGLSASKS